MPARVLRILSVTAVTVVLTALVPAAAASAATRISPAGSVVVTTQNTTVALEQSRRAGRTSRLIERRPNLGGTPVWCPQVIGADGRTGHVCGTSTGRVTFPSTWCPRVVLANGTTGHRCYQRPVRFGR